MKKSIILCILCITMIISSMFSINATEANVLSDTSDTQETVSNYYNKIHFYFDVEEYGTIDSYNELEDAIEHINENPDSTTYSLNTNNDTIQMLVKFQSSFSSTAEYQEFNRERLNLKSAEEVLDFRQRLNAFSKQYHENIIRENTPALSKLDYNKLETSSYAPYAILEFDSSDLVATQLQELAEKITVESVDLSYKPELSQDASWNQTLEGVNAYDVVSNDTYTGDGIRIGVYESGGICDVGHNNFDNLTYNIVVRDPSQSISSHANIVTSIIALMAPEARIYISEYTGLLLDWFIEKDCDIINCSWGFDYGNPEYQDSYEGVIDYQVKNHFITVVKSAGNYKSTNLGVISLPGHAYNIINVGGVDLNSNNEWVHATGACYVSTTQVKPNIAAPYTVYIPNMGTSKGTSLSAPIVTACIALKMEQNFMYIMMPEMTLSLISATATKTADYMATVGEFDDRVGAGVINLEGMLATDYCDAVVNMESDQYYGTYGGPAITYPIHLNAGDNLKIATAWMVCTDDYNETTKSISHVYVTNYDLYIRDSNYNIILTDMSDLTKSNVEMIDIVIEETGTYYIVVYQQGKMNPNNSSEIITLTYYLE